MTIHHLISRPNDNFTKWFFLLNPTEAEPDWCKSCRFSRLPALQLCLWGTGQQMPVAGWGVTEGPGGWFECSKWFGTKVHDLGRNLSRDAMDKPFIKVKFYILTGCFCLFFFLLFIYFSDFGVNVPRSGMLSPFDENYVLVVKGWF